MNNTHLYKTIFNQMPRTFSIKESEELTENIMGTIQKEGRESASILFRWVKASEYPFKHGNYNCRHIVSHQPHIQKFNGQKWVTRLSLSDFEYLQEIPSMQYQSVPVSEWISIENTMPEINIDVLCYFKSEHCEVCFSNKNGIFFNENNEPVGKPTHWMTLPKKPL